MGVIRLPSARRIVRAIYCLSEGPGEPVKIGISQRPRDRLAKVQTETWREVSIHWVVQGNHSGEQVCHHILRDALIRGEWFHDPDDSIKSLNPSNVWDLHEALRLVADRKRKGAA